jgi:Arc/MetJ-type ribon-helix-helix transcriptional regulator
MELRLKNPDLERFVDQQVQAGVFPSVDALLEEAVARLMREEEATPLSDEDWAAIAEADAEFERGETIDFDVFAAEMRKKYGIK